MGIFDERLEHARERRRVRPDDRVRRVHDVEGHLAGVGVDDDLDGVAHVVEAVGKSALADVEVAGVLRVGVLTRRRCSRRARSCTEPLAMTA